MDNHFKERECRDFHALEVVGVGRPRLLLLELGLRRLVVVKDGVRRGGGRVRGVGGGDDVVLEFPRLPCNRP